MIHYPQYVKQAYTNLVSAKLRSFLAVLGILVGTASVVALLSSGQLATEKALAQFKSLGTDLLAVTMYPEHRKDKPGQAAQSLSLQEIANIKETIPTIKNLAPYMSSYAAMNYHGKKITGPIVGATQSLKQTVAIHMQSGGFVSSLDRFRPFCVVGQDVYQMMKAINKNNPIGQQVRLGQYYFTVIGVMAPWPENNFVNHNLNQAVIIPIQASKLINDQAKISDMLLSVLPDTDLDQLQIQLRAQIKQHAPNLRLFFRSSKQIIKSMKTQHQIFTLLLALIGSISLIVGGIGVMNIMLASVAERHREIGIRKAIGARNKDIQQLFLTESVILALFGGILGITVGIVTSLIIAYFADWGFKIFLIPPLVGFTVSAATGIFFGFYPAYRASQLDPIQTLRYE